MAIETIETKADLEAFIKQRLPTLLPNLQAILGVQTHSPGDIKSSARPAAETGWLLCDGSPVSRATYSGLFDAIGTAYGAGDGVTTFNVPDLRGRTVVGKGTHADVNALNNNDGLAVASRTPKHTHAFSGNTGNNSDFPSGLANGAGVSAVSFSPHTHAFSGTTATGTAPYATVQFYVKT